MLLLIVYDGSVTLIAFKGVTASQPSRSKSTAAQAVVPLKRDVTGRRFEPFMLTFATQDEVD